MPIRKKRLK